MKKIVYTLIFSLLVVISIQAQVDRSVQPKPGPSPKVNIGKPQSFTLPNGLTVLVVENHKLPRVSFSLLLDNPPILEGDLAGVNYLTSNMMGNGTSKISKDDFNSRIEYLGANVSFGIGGVSGSSLSRYFPEVFSLAVQGALDPLFTQEDFDSEKVRLIDGLKTQEKSASFIIGRVSKALLYGKNHPKGEFEVEETINRVSLADVKDFYSKNFVPEKAYLVVVGDVKFNDVKKLVNKDFSEWKKASAPKSVYSEPVNLSQTEINFIDVPSAVQAEIYVMSVTNLKMTDPDYFAALLANQILGGGGDARLFLNLREAHGWTYGSYSSLRGNKYISNFTASASVRNLVADSAVVEILKELDKIRTTLPTQEELDLVKAKFVGNFVMNVEKPQTVASYALSEKTQSLPADFFENYIKNINKVSLADVQKAAQKYLLSDGVRIVIAGKGSEIIPNLERLNIPVKYFDKNANPTANPMEARTNLDITATEILKKYIEAIGGETTLKNVKTLQTISEGEHQGQKISIIQKATSSNKALQEILMNGTSVFKLAFDGKGGYMSFAGQVQDIPTSEVADMKYALPFPELLLVNSADEVLLEGVEDGSYVIKAADSRKFYYDVNTFLKTAEGVLKDSMPEQKIYLSDYKDTEGVKIPYKTIVNIMGMDIALGVTDVKINTGVSDSDFAR